jgi:hypothetical protein
MLGWWPGDGGDQGKNNVLGTALVPLQVGDGT